MIEALSEVALWLQEGMFQGVVGLLLGCGGTTVQFKFRSRNNVTNGSGNHTSGGDQTNVEIHNVHINVSTGAAWADENYPACAVKKCRDSSQNMDREMSDVR